MAVVQEVAAADPLFLAAQAANLREEEFLHLEFAHLQAVQPLEGVHPQAAVQEVAVVAADLPLAVVLRQRLVLAAAGQG